MIGGDFGRFGVSQNGGQRQVICGVVEANICDHSPDEFFVRLGGNIRDEDKT